MGIILFLELSEICERMVVHSNWKIGKHFLLLELSAFCDCDCVLNFCEFYFIRPTDTQYLQFAIFAAVEWNNHVTIVSMR